MRTLLLDIWDRLRTSLWFIPALMAVSATALAVLLVWMQDWHHSEWFYQTRWLAKGDPDGARAILATIAGSVITVTGVSFSVTVVALSLASQQFGPRLLRTFMRDRSNQFVLGTFLGTFVYAMLVLRVVQEGKEQIEIPYLAVSVAVILALVALAVLIYFIHHLVVSLQTDSVILHVLEELHETIRALYAHTIDWPHSDGEPAYIDSLPRGYRVTAAKAGYVRALDVAGLREIADRHDLVISVTQRPGRFVIDHEAIALIHTDDPLNEGQLESVIQHVRRSFLIGPARTGEQDIEFSIAQLVEVAVRSLSPSINDPFTTMTCLDRLGEVIAQLSRYPLPKPEEVYSGDQLRVLIDRPDFSGMVHLAFDQVRQNVRDKPAVIIHMLDVLGTVIEYLKHDRARAEPLLRQAIMLHQGAMNQPLESYDQHVIVKRFERVMRSAQPDGADESPAQSI